MRERQRDSTWVDRELAVCQFKDERLRKRFRNLLEQLSEGTGERIPMACQDWANTKAAYRFFANARVNENDILAGHFQATRDRFAATDGTVFVLQDTSEFSYQREKPELIGFTRKVKSVRKRAKGVYGDAQINTVCGLLMHSSARLKSSEPILSFEPALIAWLETANIRLPMKWMRFRSRDYITLSCATSEEIHVKLCLN